MKKQYFSKLLLGVATCLVSTAAVAQTPTIAADGNPIEWPSLLSNPAYPKSVGHDLYNSSLDSIFTSGATASSAVSAWQWGTGTPSAKNDIENYGVVIADSMLRFYVDLYAGNGDNNVDIWLFAGNVGRSPDGPPTFTGAHAEGDMLIRARMSNGGGVLTYKIYRWVVTAGTNNPVLQSYPVTIASIATNTGTPNVPSGMPSSFSYSYKSTGAAGSSTNPGAGKYPQATFLEGFINLNAIANDPLAQCFQSYLITSTSGSTESLTAGYTDFVSGKFPSKPLAYVVNADTTVCAGASLVTLRGGAVAGYGTAPYTFKWSSTGTCDNPGCLIGTGANLDLTNVTNSGIYYLTAYSSYGCVSEVKSAHVTVSTVTPPSTIGAAACAASGPATLNASGSTGTYKWYNAVTGGSCLNTGITYTPTISGTTTYYVAAINAMGCASTKTPVTDTLLSTYTIEASSDAYGSISDSGITSHCQRDNVTYTFTSAYPVQNVMVDGVSKGKPSSWTFSDLNANHTIAVTFCNPTTWVAHDSVKVNSDQNLCGASVTLSDATANGTPAPAIAYSQVGFFNVGTTIDTVRAMNACGSASSTFKVIVIDNQAPVFTFVPHDTTVNANYNGCNWIGDIGTPIVSDNCGALIPTSNAPLTFPLGTTTVTWTATDAAGHTVTATQLITVVNPVTVSVSLSMLPVIANGTQADGTMYWGYQHEQFTAIPSGATEPVTYAWETGGTTQTITQYPSSEGFSEFDQNVTITDANGCTASAYGGADKNVLDARCGNTNQKVSVCHWDNGSKVMKTICIDQTSVADHMDHTHMQDGTTVYDYCGPCIALAKGAAAVAETNSDINLYPNPNTGSFIMEIPATSDALVITITDLNGRVVETRNVAASDNGQHLEISLNSVSKGIYMVQAVGGELSFRTKLVIE